MLLSPFQAKPLDFRLLVCSKKKKEKKVWKLQINKSTNCHNLRKVRKYDKFCTSANLRLFDLCGTYVRTPTFGYAATKMCYNNLYLLVCKYIILYKALDWTGKDNSYSESNVKCLQLGASFIILYVNNNKISVHKLCSMQSVCLIIK